MTGAGPGAGPTAGPEGGDPSALLAAVARVVAWPEAPGWANAVARLLGRSLAADGCLVFEVTEREVALVGRSAARGDGEPPPPLRYPPGRGVVGRVAVDGVAAVLVDDRPRDPLHRTLLGLADGQPVSRACVPGRVAGGPVAAVLAVYATSSRQFTPGEVAVVHEVADLVALRLRAEHGDASAAARQDDWEALVAATITAAETERRRVAADLHDGVSQAIAGLLFRISAAELALQAGDPADAGEQLRVARELADLATGETRSAITGLHSPVLDDLGLAAGLVSMARSVPQLQVDVDAEELALPDHVTVALFRIAQEAVQNVVKHAAAGRAEVRLSRHGGTVVLTVDDDGHGFDAPGVIGALPHRDPERPRYGLSGMFERVQLLGGQLAVSSRPEGGTRVRAVIPLLPPSTPTTPIS